MHWALRGGGVAPAKPIKQKSVEQFYKKRMFSIYLSNEGICWTKINSKWSQRKTKVYDLGERDLTLARGLDSLDNDRRRVSCWIFTCEIIFKFDLYLYYFFISFVPTRWAEAGALAGISWAPASWLRLSSGGRPPGDQIFYHRLDQLSTWFWARLVAMNSMERLLAP